MNNFKFSLILVPKKIQDLTTHVAGTKFHFLKNYQTVFLFCLLLLCCTHSSWGNPSEASQIGVGYGYTTTFLKTGEAPFPVLPIFSWNSELFFIRGLTAGFKFYRKFPAINLILTPQMLAIEHDAGTYNEGLKKRNRTLHGGVQIIVPTPIMQIRWQLEQDLLGEHHSWVTSIHLQKRALLSSSLSLMYGIYWQFFSTQYTRHYFGIDESEARADRPYYHPSHGQQYGPTLNFIYQISSDYSFTLMNRYTLFNDEITHSPLVEKNHQYGFIATISKSF